MRGSAYGFTLIELIVVMSIIGILAATSFALINPLREIAKARDSDRKTDLSKLQAGLELFYSDFSSYPEANNLTASLTQGTTKYIDSVPVDPKTEVDYAYNPQPAGCIPETSNPCTSYELYTCLENTQDNNTDENRGKTPQSGCPSNTTSFTVYSP